MRKRIVAAIFGCLIGVTAISPAWASQPPGQLGYEGQPGNHANGSGGYEGQPGNQAAN